VLAFLLTVRLWVLWHLLGDERIHLTVLYFLLHEFPDEGVISVGKLGFYTKCTCIPIQLECLSSYTKVGEHATIFT
jgi:hypothetical protein